MSSNDELVRNLTNQICDKLQIPNKPYNIENEMFSKFMLNLHEKSKDLKEFKEKLVSMGAPELVEDSFIAKVDALIRGQTVKLEPKVKVESVVKVEDYEFSVPTEIDDKKFIKKEYDEVPRPQKRKLTEDIIYDSSELNKIYKGRVVNITKFGAFIRLFQIKPKNGRSPDGLCHISAISNERISHPGDVLKLNEEVFVKLTDIQHTERGLKLSLSMKNIDQVTGEEKFDNRGRTTNMQSMELPRRRMTSPERWQISQLIASGVLSAKDYPELSEDVNAAFMQDRESADEINQEVEIELKKEEPPFLRGHEYKSIEVDPIKIIKKPEGSLNRAALSGSALIRERKEKKQEELKKSKEEKLKDLAKRRKIESDPFQQQQQQQIVTDEENPIKLSLIESEWKRQVKEQSLGKRTNLSIKEQRETLPVFQMRSTLVDAVRNNQFLVVVGETGSGKTTQITQYLAEEGFNSDGKIIACTQPRRVAAISIAKRVADEVGCKVGEEVGYTVRFEDVTSKDTKIKYMTDGMLQKEVSGDPDVSNYSVIMLDEAHERTIATDVLFSLLKKACSQNPNLKLIVTSATLDAEKFSKFFNDCPIIKIPGKTFPVEVYYTNEPEFDYINACLDAVMEIHTTQPAGDILVFLTGQEEIDTCCEMLFQRTKVLGDAIPELIVLPVYSALPSEMQSRIFEPTPLNKRKVIVATNIAETSITIDGIYYVIDPGFVKLNAFDPKLGMDSLIISPISQAQANQRKGRAGRTGPGKCYRLYTQALFNNEMMAQTIPEIQRQNLSNTILMLKAMGIDDLLNFEFLDPPPANNILTSLEELYALEALDDEGNLNELGRQMANFPMEPSLSKTLLISLKFGCTEEILTIVAMLSVQSFFYRPKEKLNQADQRKLKFHHPMGDHLTLLNLFQQWSQNQNDSKKWCLDNFVHERSMRRAKDVKYQLTRIMKRYKHSITSCGNDTDTIRKALCAGFFKNSAKRDSANSCYQTLIEKTSIYMHPSSSLFHKQNSDYVIYHTLLLTTKEYMHCVTVIDPNWLVEFAPNFFTKNDPHKLSDAKRSEKIQPLYNKFDQSQSWRLTKLKSAKQKALGGK